MTHPSKKQRVISMGPGILAAQTRALQVQQVQPFFSGELGECCLPLTRDVLQVIFKLRKSDHLSACQLTLKVQLSISENYLDKHRRCL